VKTNVEPTPVGNIRALEIWESKGPAGAFDVTPGEDAYVKEVWELLGGESSWASALLNIAHGGAVPAGRLQKGDVLTGAGNGWLTDAGGRWLRVTVTGVSLYKEIATIYYCRPNGTLTSIRMDAREPVLIDQPDPRDVGQKGGAL
jgi:hypothetical protein